MGLFLSIGVIWLTYQVFNSIEVESSSKKSKVKMLIGDSSDRNVA